MDLVKKYVLRLPQGIVTMEKDELVAKVKEILKDHVGFVKSMWCGDLACEEKVKEETGMPSRCMPFEQEHLADTCVCCGKPAKTMVYWGKAY